MGASLCNRPNDVPPALGDDPELSPAKIIVCLVGWEDFSAIL